MSDRIGPALTPEEWAKRRKDVGPEHVSLAPLEPGLDPWGEPWPDDPDPILEIGDGGDTGSAQKPEIFHAIAALCLRGQPFGFTRDDVALIRELRAPLMSLKESDRGSSLARGLASLADRIEALLPPEK